MASEHGEFEVPVERTGLLGARSTRLALLREPALPIVLLASLAMIDRRYLPDIALFVGTAALIVTDSGRWRDRVASAEPDPVPARHLFTAALAAAAVAAAMSGLPRTSPLTDTVFAAIGLTALLLAWNAGPGRRPGTEPPAPARWRVWPGLAVALALAEFWSFLHQPAPMVDSPQHPTVSTVVEPGLDEWTARAVALWVWLMCGWWLLRRIRAWAR